ncbi:hypothetical protein UFOVP529_84 [uncultured Caudovirales phage]|uniref:Uncharacterized protein n=1 Tax=uncultured Caudovirales phage TaxID=2100421 RepID=A0A6J5MW30_9CAUD|nr:hypothetical protein UFOVP529_84 [uncultured Caudovirales phage]CAB4189918.1 hypothetical protein UFOVP1191_22 [uncultured Caudovirales phage]CAB4194391.1 hypothetical protein UFOVP1252_37 [uncultured Caudovirales phage]
MTSTRKKTTAKRTAVKTATYYDYGIKKNNTTVAGNYAGFVTGALFTFVIYLLARAFGI